MLGKYTPICKHIYPVPTKNCVLASSTVYQFILHVLFQALGSLSRIIWHNLLRLYSPVHSKNFNFFYHAIYLIPLFPFVFFWVIIYVTVVAWSRKAKVLQRRGWIILLVTVIVRAIPFSGDSYSDSVTNFFTNYYSSSYMSHQMVYLPSTVRELVVSFWQTYNFWQLYLLLFCKRYCNAHSFSHYSIHKCIYSFTEILF